MTAGSEKALDQAFASILSFPGRQLSGLSLLAIRDGRPEYEGYFGVRRFGRADQGIDQGVDQPVDSETRWRVASISKLSTAIGAMILVERGLLDPDADISGYLGFSLRNPRYPDIPITARALLSHTSGLRDAGYYYPPLGCGIRELFEPDGRYFDDGAHFAKAIPGKDTRPGRFYCYCNLGYGVLATAMERITQKRFDLFMGDELFAPLGIDSGFNVNLVSDERFGDISPIYRKSRGEDGPWDPYGPWIPQTDNFLGVRPALPVRTPEEEAASGGEGALASALEPPLRLEKYEIGTNGSLFSPQGGLRIRARDLAKIAALLAGKGEVEPSRFDGTEAGPFRRAVRLLSEESVDAMSDPVWTRAPDGSNCEDPAGLALATGWGLMKSRGPVMAKGDGIAESCRWWGHHGDAYGFLGATLFDPAKRDAYLYMIGGVGADPERNRDPESNLFVWEHELRRVIETRIYGS